jgi:hypothetical protein
VSCNYASDIGKPDAGPLKLFLPVEALKYTEEFFGVFHVKSDSVVLYGKNAFPLAGTAAYIDLGLGARTGKFYRIGDKVDKHQPQHGCAS